MGDYKDFDETVQAVDKSVFASVIFYCFILFYLFIEMNLNLLPICLEVSKKRFSCEYCSGHQFFPLTDITSNLNLQVHLKSFFSFRYFCHFSDSSSTVDFFFITMVLTHH